VTTPGGTSATSPKDVFEYTPVPPPTVTKLSRNKGTAAGGTTVIITGTNLSEETAVNFGATSATQVTVTSATSITAITPAENPGIVAVTVTTPSGTSTGTVSSANEYAYTPAITKLTPRNGTALGGTVVQVEGAGFAIGKTATAFMFDTTAATSAECTSASKCTVVAPAHAPGKVAVRATVNEQSSPEAGSAEFSYT
jgi:hypothetical protein